MAKRDIVDEKARSNIPGSGLGRVYNSDAWGEQKATERYGGGTKTYQPPADQSAPQFRQDQCADKTYNDHKNDWVRGANQDATKRPGYVPGYKGKR